MDSVGTKKELTAMLEARARWLAWIFKHQAWGRYHQGGQQYAIDQPWRPFGPPANSYDFARIGDPFDPNALKPRIANENGQDVYHFLFGDYCRVSFVPRPKAGSAEAEDRVDPIDEVATGGTSKSWANPGDEPMPVDLSDAETVTTADRTRFYAEVEASFSTTFGFEAGAVKGSATASIGVKAGGEKEGRVEKSNELRESFKIMVPPHSRLTLPLHRFRRRERLTRTIHAELDCQIEIWSDRDFDCLWDTFGELRSVIAGVGSENRRNMSDFWRDFPPARFFAEPDGRDVRGSYNEGEFLARTCGPLQASITMSRDLDGITGSRWGDPVIEAL